MWFGSHLTVGVTRRLLLAWNQSRIFENSISSLLVPRGWQWKCLAATSPLSVSIAAFFVRRCSAAWTRFDRSRTSRINVVSYTAGPAKIMFWEGLYLCVGATSRRLPNFPLGQAVLSGCGNVSPLWSPPSFICVLHFESNLRSTRESPTLPHCSLVWPQLQQFARRWFVLCPMW